MFLFLFSFKTLGFPILKSYQPLKRQHSSHLMQTLASSCVCLPIQKKKNNASSLTLISAAKQRQQQLEKTLKCQYCVCVWGGEEGGVNGNHL